MKTWLLAVIRALLATGSYMLGASLQIVPGMALRLYLGLGVLVAAVTFVVEYVTNIRPTRHWREVIPVMIDEMTTSFVEFLRDAVGVTPRLHIMVPRRTWRWCGVRRYFVIWKPSSPHQGSSGDYLIPHIRATDARTSVRQTDRRAHA